MEWDCNGNDDEQQMELNDDQQVLDTSLPGDSYIGLRVAKYFGVYDDIFHAIVSKFDDETGWWKILYDDGDSEELDFDELRRAMNLQSALNSNKSTAFRQVAKIVIRYLDSFDHDTSDWGALLQKAHSCAGKFHLNKPANPSKEVWYSFHIDRIFALCKQCGQSAACANGEEVFTIDRVIALEAIFAMTMNPSPSGWWDGITHGLEKCRENGRNLILNFIDYMVETHGTVSKGQGQRHTPSHGKQMSQQVLFRSLVNLSNNFQKASDGSATESAQQSLMCTLDKGGCYGVGDLTAGEIAHVATAVGLVTNTSNAKTLDIAKTTKTFSRLVQLGIRTDEQCRELQRFIAAIFGTTDLSLVENWLCEALRLESGSRLGVDTILKEQQYLYKINDCGVLIRIDVNGNEDPAPRIIFDDTAKSCAKPFPNGISWWDGEVGDGDIEITLSNRKNPTDNNAGRTAAAVPSSDDQDQIQNALESGQNFSLPELLHLRETGLSAAPGFLRFRRDTPCVTFSSLGSVNGQYLVYHLRCLDGRYDGGWDPSSIPLQGQKAGHPLRNHQPASVKECNRGVTDGLFFIDTSIQVEVSTSRCDNDLVIVHRGLHHVPHGSGFLTDKASADETLRNSDVNVIDVPEYKRTFSMQREDDSITVYRSGTSEADRVSMSARAKKEFLSYLMSQSCMVYRTNDAGRDVGNKVYRYDLLFNQAQRNCHVYADADGCLVVDSNGNPMRVPNLRRQTEMIRMLPENVRGEFTRVLAGMDGLARQLDPRAFHDERRHQLVHDHFVRDFLGDHVSINWEYVGLIARKITGQDRLAMHLDIKNDWRPGYDTCSTYSYVIDGYRVTVVAACKQDFGSLMERLDEVEVEGGLFLPPDQVGEE